MSLLEFKINAIFHQDSQFKEYLPELRKHMEGRVDTPDLCLEEESMCLDFDLKKSWREG